MSGNCCRSVLDNILCGIMYRFRVRALNEVYYDWSKFMLVASDWLKFMLAACNWSKFMMTPSNWWKQFVAYNSHFSLAEIFT